MMWYNSGYDSAEVLQRVRHLPPSWSLRSAFGYQNIMYVAAGELIAKVAGAPWERIVKERIFAPLGMGASRVDVSEVENGSNVALRMRSLTEGLPQSLITLTRIRGPPAPFIRACPT